MCTSTRRDQHRCFVVLHGEDRRFPVGMENGIGKGLARDCVDEKLT